MYNLHIFAYLCIFVHILCKYAYKYTICAKIPIFSLYSSISIYISILCPTFCSIFIKNRPGKYLPGCIFNISLQNVGRNISISLKYT